VDERSKTIVGIFGILAAMFAAVMLVFALDHLHFLSERVPFNAAQWRTRSLSEGWKSPMRQRMVDDLVAGKRLDRLTREQVETLLGRDDKTAHWPEWDLRYRVAPARHFRWLDWEWLVVGFGQDGHVAAYHVVTD